VRRFLGILLVVAGIGIPAAAAAPARTRLDFYVYDLRIPEVAVIGATVTVAYDGGVAVGQTRPPHGRVRITLPDRYESVLVAVDANAYCETVFELTLSGGSRAGGHGVFVGLTPEPCAVRP